MISRFDKERRMQYRENTCILCKGTGVVKDWDRHAKKLEEKTCQFCLGSGIRLVPSSD